MTDVTILGIRAAQTLPWLLPMISKDISAKRRVWILVPEHYTLQAEQELIEGLDLHGLLDVDVISPKRLKKLIVDTCGHGPLPSLDDRGRAMVFALSLIRSERELSYYHTATKHSGLPDKLAALVSDMEKAEMQPSDLIEYAEAQKLFSTRQKLKDIALIWAKYKELVKDKFADPVDEQSDQLERLSRSGVMHMASLYVCGFDVIQPNVAEIIAVSAREASSVTVALTMSERSPDEHVFLAQWHTALRLSSILSQRGIHTRFQSMTPDRGNISAELCHLERHLFSTRPIVFPLPTTVIGVHTASNPYEEANYVAARLRAWHEHDGIPWSAMAIALSGEGELTSVIDMTLKLARIPHFMTRKADAHRHGMCRMLTAAVRAVCNGYERRDVLAALKSGFAPLDEKEAFLLENYAMENGIQRNKWRMPFSRGTNASEMEQLRIRLMTPLQALHDRLRNAKDAADSVEALYVFLQEINAYQTLLKNELALEQNGFHTTAAENRQIWRVVMALFDQLYTLLGGRRANMKDLSSLIESGLLGIQIGTLPPEADAVAVGAAGHLTTGSIDMLAVMGLQDGVTGSSTDSLIAETERDEISQHFGRQVGLSREEQSALRKMDFYRTLTLPRKGLLLTCSGGTGSGDALRESTLLHDVCRVFPGCAISGGVSHEETSPISPMMAAEGISLRLRKIAYGEEQSLTREWQGYLKWLWQSPEWHRLIQGTLSDLMPNSTTSQLTTKQADVLYAQDRWSISRLESYAECPYRHFIDWGIKPQERREFIFQADEKGTFYHGVLQRYLNLAGRDATWPLLSRETIQRYVHQAAEPFLVQWQGGPLSEDSVGRAMAEEYLRIVQRSAQMLTAQSAHGEFVTIGTEMRFGGEGAAFPPVMLHMPDHRELPLQGVIDRIDEYRCEQGVFRRVIDYKSSRHELQELNVREGLQLQLLLYLQAATNADQRIFPAGCFYYHISDPLLSVQDDDDVRLSVEDRLAPKMRLNGVVLSDEQIIHAMNGESNDYVIGPMMNKNGTLRKNASLLDSTGFHTLMRHARQKATEIASHICEGGIDVSPAEIGDWKACQYCKYQGVCGFDPARIGYESRRIRTEKHTSWQDFADSLGASSPESSS